MSFLSVISSTSGKTALIPCLREAFMSMRLGMLKSPNGDNGFLNSQTPSADLIRMRWYKRA